MQITTEIKQYELSENKAQQLEAVFIPMLDMLKPMESDFNQIIDYVETKGIDEDIIVRAKRLRLDIGKVRIETEKKRKTEKDESLKLGKAIDGIANIVKYAVSSKEDKLKEIETHFERLEEERNRVLGIERANLLSHYLTIDLIDTKKLSAMDQDVFDAYLCSKKTEFEAKKAEAERVEREQVEARLLKEFEDRKIREENNRLKEKALREAKEAEERHLAEIKALIESSTEITIKEIERAKKEGKAVFVKVVKTEISNQSGIFFVK